MEAFEVALAAGADMIEFDVRRTADEKLVVFHDPTIRRTALDQLTHAELCDQAGIPVPRLEEVLEWAPGRIALDVELKEDGYVERAGQLLDGFLAAGGELIVTSFTDPVLAQLPRLRTGLLLSFTALGAGGRAKAVGASALVVERKLLAEPVFADAAAHELELLVWDYLPASDTALLADGRVAGVITDDVTGALAARSASSPV